MFRIQDGRVNFRSRFVRNERYVAQEKAGRILFPMYRNPYMDDPSVKGKSRGTHNTHIIHHNGLLLALKEDSPPAAMDLNTLATVDPVYTFNGQLPRTQPFTAHPKTDSETGNMLAFGYEAKGSRLRPGQCVRDHAHGQEDLGRHRHGALCRHAARLPDDRELRGAVRDSAGPRPGSRSSAAASTGPGIRASRRISAISAVAAMARISSGSRDRSAARRT